MLKHFNFMMTSSLVLPVLTFGLDLHEFQNLKLYNIIKTSQVIPSVQEVKHFCLSQFPIYFFIYLVTSTIWYGTHNRARLHQECPLQITHPGQERLATPLGSTSPNSNSGVGSFTSPKDQISESSVRRDLRFFVLIREDQKV